MIFEELLEKCIQQKVNIKVGSGTLHWYCGKATADLPKLVNKISNEYYKKWMVKEQKQVKKIADLKKKCKKEKSKTKKEKLEKTLRFAEKQREKLLDYIISWKPLLKREVEYCIAGISYDEPNTLVIKLVGEELGKFWTIKEYNDYQEKLNERKETKNEKKNDKLRLRDIRIIQRKCRK